MIPRTYDAWKTTPPDTYDEPPRCKCEQPCDCAGPLTKEEVADIERQRRIMAMSDHRETTTNRADAELLDVVRDTITLNDNLMRCILIEIEPLSCDLTKLWKLLDTWHNRDVRLRTGRVQEPEQSQ